MGTTLDESEVTISLRALKAQGHRESWGLSVAGLRAGCYTVHIQLERQSDALRLQKDKEVKSIQQNTIF